MALIRDLERIRKRPGMYVGKVNVESVITFVGGFRCAAYSALGVSSFLGNLHLGNMEDAILNARGWKKTPIHWSQQMIQAGMSTEEMVDELFAVEIAVWHRIAEHNVLAMDEG